MDTSQWKSYTQPREFQVTADSRGQRDTAMSSSDTAHSPLALKTSDMRSRHSTHRKQDGQRWSFRSSCWHSCWLHIISYQCSRSVHSRVHRSWTRHQRGKSTYATTAATTEISAPSPSHWQTWWPTPTGPAPHILVSACRCLGLRCHTFSG
jgi:hypothetical protein